MKGYFGIGIEGPSKSMNVGTLFRTAHAFGASFVFTLRAQYDVRAGALAEKHHGAPNKVVFFKTGDRRIVRADTPVLDSAGTTVGRVLSGTLSPLLNEAIGSALVTTAASSPLKVDIRGTALELFPVRPPFVELKKN